MTREPTLIFHLFFPFIPALNACTVLAEACY